MVFCQSRRKAHEPNDLALVPTPTLVERRAWLRKKHNEDGGLSGSVLSTLKLVETELGWREHRKE